MKKTALRAEPGAGHPFLSFLNTVSDDGKTRVQNSFSNAVELREGLDRAGIAMPVDISPEQMTEMLRLREAAFDVFSAIAKGNKPDPEENTMLTSALHAALSEAELRITKDGLSTAPRPSATPFVRVVFSMEDLLRSDQFTRLRECRRCTHMFLDQGRGVGRRWCSMARCGNRAKAEKFRARHRDAA